MSEEKKTNYRLHTRAWQMSIYIVILCETAFKYQLCCHHKKKFIHRWMTQFANACLSVYKQYKRYCLIHVKILTGVRSLAYPWCDYNLDPGIIWEMSLIDIQFDLICSSWCPSSVNSQRAPAQPSFWLLLMCRHTLPTYVVQTIGAEHIDWIIQKPYWKIDIQMPHSYSCCSSCK